MQLAPVIKFSLDSKKENLNITILNKKRLTVHGFGCFLEKAKVGEVVATQEAFDIILNSPFRRGLRPLEVFNGEVIGFCARCFDVSEISLHDGASEWFKKVCLIVTKEKRAKNESESVHTD